MKALSRMTYRKSLYIKKVCCCGCFFDKVCYLLNSNDLISYEAFESNFGAHWYFKDFISGIIVIVCDDILPFLTEQEQLK